MSALVLLALAGAFWATWSLWLGDAWAAPDTKNVDPIKVAQYVASPRFDRLSGDRRRVYMDAVRQEKDQIVDAYMKKQVSAQEYEAVLVNAWISRTLSHAQEFSKIQAGKRERYLDHLFDRSQQERKEMPRPDGSLLWDKDPYTLPAVLSLVTSLPPEQRAQWEDFRAALRARRAAKGLPPAPGIWY